MRRPLSFVCEGSTLFATLDEAARSTGLLIVSGGNEIRIGAHRGMAELAADVAIEGHPVLRFDRRGIGDSEGENRGFESSATDLAAAIAAFRAACPHITCIIAFGNCDAASALLLHQPEGVAALVLANIWTIEGESDLPPPSAIKARYLERMRDPRAWLRLLGGGVSLKKLAAGLFRLARPSPPPTPTSLPQRVAEGLARFPGPVSILLAKGDATALAFMDCWRKPMFDTARARADVQLIELDSSSHSFASEADYTALKATLLGALRA